MIIELLNFEWLEYQCVWIRGRGLMIHLTTTPSIFLSLTFTTLLLAALASEYETWESGALNCGINLKRSTPDLSRSVAKMTNWCVFSERRNRFIASYSFDFFFREDSNKWDLSQQKSLGLGRLFFRQATFELTHDRK